MPTQSNLPLEKVLQTALRSTKITCVLGSANKLEDTEKSNGWTQVTYARNKFGNGKFFSKSERLPTKFDYDNVGAFNKAKIDKIKWYYHPNTKIDPPHIYFLRQDIDPLNDPIFNITQQQKILLTLALNLEHQKMGNCEALSRILMKKLWELSLVRKDIKRIELACAVTFNHYFVLVNRQSGTNNGWIIDPWYENGVIQPMSNFYTIMPKIKCFLKEQMTKLRELDINAHDELYSNINNMQCEIMLEINPEQNKYPTYNSLLTISDYYIPYNYPGNYTAREKKIMQRVAQNEDADSKRFLALKKFERIFFFINSSLQEHKSKLQPCLDKITKQDSLALHLRPQAGI